MRRIRAVETGKKAEGGGLGVKLGVGAAVWALTTFGLSGVMNGSGADGAGGKPVAAMAAAASDGAEARVSKKVGDAWARQIENGARLAAEAGRAPEMTEGGMAAPSAQDVAAAAGARLLPSGAAVCLDGMSVDLGLDRVGDRLGVVSTGWPKADPACGQP